MQTLNKTATKIFQQLTKELDGKTRHSRRFDEHDYWPKCKGGIMAVHVENIGSINGYPYFSIAHYYKQNGDMVADPEMTFINVEGKIYPVNYTQHNLGLFTESIRMVEGRLMVSKRMQADHVSFANQWMQNIKEQQGL